LQFGSVKLAITQEDHSRVGRHNLMNLGEQLLMHALGEMAFGTLDDNPAVRQGAPVIDHTEQQGDTAAPDHTTVHNQLYRLRGQCVEQLLSNRKKPAVYGLSLVLEKAPKSLDQAFLAGTVAGRVIGDCGQVRVFAASQTADQGAQRIEVFFAMAGRTWLEELHHGAFYGTIAAIRVAHGAPPDWKRSQARRSISRVARITL
jgi:hypothetical protein